MSRVDTTGRADGGGAESREHLDADALLAFAEASSTASQAGSVARHVEACSSCRSLVQDLRDYPVLDAPSERFQVDENETRRGLAALRARQLEHRARAGIPSAPSPPLSPSRATPLRAAPLTSSAPSRRRVSAWLAWAATLAVALGWALHGELASRRSDREIASLVERLTASETQLRAPQPNAKILRLQPIDNPLRGPRAVAVPLERLAAILVFQLEEPWLEGSYTCEIRTPDGELALRIDHLEPQEIGLTLALPPKALPSGAYEARLIHDATLSETPPFELLVSQ